MLSLILFKQSSLASAMLIFFQARFEKNCLTSRLALIIKFFIAVCIQSGKKNYPKRSTDTFLLNGQSI